MALQVAIVVRLQKVLVFSHLHAHISLFATYNLQRLEPALQSLKKGVLKRRPADFTGELLFVQRDKAKTDWAWNDVEVHSALHSVLHAMTSDALSVLGGSASKRNAFNLSFRRY